MAHHYFLISILSSLLLSTVNSQSNYADQANNIGYVGEGLPEQATLDGKVTKLDDLSPVIFLNRTKAALNCAAGSMQVELKFNSKFYGIAYADFDRNSACQVFGKGGYNYKLELPLKGCGTKQDPQRVFTNNIVVRFHPGLEIDGDEIITIVCRYPPPVAPVPAALPAFIKDDGVVAPILEPPLKGFQILLIICGILFLSLLLLGLGCSYYCLRRRPLTVIRRHPFSSIGSDSEITKLSGSSLGNLSMFEGLKIPRAHAPVAAVASSSSSEGPLISDTLPSDYPSESHSEIEELDVRSLPASSAGSFENKAYLQDSSSFYSEGYGHTQEQEVQNAVATPAMVPRLPLAIKEQPKFDVQVRVKRPVPSPPSLSISDSESSIARTERNLSTILEQREESVRSIDSPLVESTQFTYIPELHPPPKYIQPAPTYNRILRKKQEIQESIASLGEQTDTHSMTEVMDDSHARYVVPTPPPPPVIIPREHHVVDFAPPQAYYPPAQMMHQPQITSHMVDDVYLKTITEKKTIEDIERHKRLVTEYHTRPKPKPEQIWDVTIKNYPLRQQPPDWENFSDISSASGLTNASEKPPVDLPPQNVIDDNKLPLNAPELVGSLGKIPVTMQPEEYLTAFNIPLENPTVPNWNVLIRVFQPNELYEDSQVIESAETFNSQLTVADKIKWRQIITTESTLRTLLTEAVIREDYERISHDTRYQKIFEPVKWDVIIRILSPVDKRPRFKKKGDQWDTRSRRSSLPTLYEYDSDGGSSVRTLIKEQSQYPGSHYRKSSEYRSEADLRSMSEMTVEFGRPSQGPDSETTSHYRLRFDPSDDEYQYNPGALARSLSQPSLARSASEFTERWVAPSRYDTESEFTGSPLSQRSSRFLQRGTELTSSLWQQANVAGPSRQGEASVAVQRQEFRSQQSTFRQGQPVVKSDWFAEDDNDTDSHKF